MSEKLQRYTLIGIAFLALQWAFGSIFENLFYASILEYSGIKEASVTASLVHNFIPIVTAMVVILWVYFLGKRDKITAKEANIKILDTLYHEGVSIRGHFNGVEWQPWGGDMDEWKGKAQEAAYKISTALGAQIKTPNIYNNIPACPPTNHYRPQEQWREICRVLNILDDFFKDEWKQEQQQRHVTR